MENQKSFEEKVKYIEEMMIKNLKMSIIHNYKLGEINKKLNETLKLFKGDK